MITLYHMPSSGNSYKVRLLFAHLGIACRGVPTEYEDGAELTVQDAFRAKNPAGKVPLVEFDDGQTLAESNAILTYFGEGTRFWPKDALTRARMFQWMFWEQNAHEGVIAVRAALRTYEHRKKNATPERMTNLLAAGHKALDVMEARLSRADWLAGDGMTLADICLYAYTHTAETKGGFDLASRPGIRAWLDRVASEPGHVGMDWQPAPH